MTKLSLHRIWPTTMKTPRSKYSRRTRASTEQPRLLALVIASALLSLHAYQSNFSVFAESRTYTATYDNMTSKFATAKTIDRYKYLLILGTVRGRNTGKENRDTISKDSESQYSFANVVEVEHILSSIRSKSASTTWLSWFLNSSNMTKQSWLELTGLIACSIIMHVIFDFRKSWTFHRSATHVQNRFMT